MIEVERRRLVPRPSRHQVDLDVRAARESRLRLEAC